MGEAILDGESGSRHILATGDIYRGRGRVWTNSAEQGYRGDSVLATQE